MLVWSNGGPVAVIAHPDRRGLSDSYEKSAGACFASWRGMAETNRRLQLMVDAWHASAFYGVPVADVHRALLVIPEYRDMIADDCLPREYRQERA